MVSRNFFSLVYVQACLIFVCTFVVYYPSMKGEFLHDDAIEIAGNSNIKELSDLNSILFKTYQLPVRPVPYLTFALNYAVNGIDTMAYHIVNNLIHAVNGCLILLILRFLLPCILKSDSSNCRELSFLLALIWVVHPLNTSAVAYIYQRIEQLWVMFCLLTIWCFMRGVQSNRPRNYIFYVCSIVSSSLGMLSKEVMFVTPILVLLLDRIYFSQNWKVMLSHRWLFHLLLFSTWIVLYLILSIQDKEYSKFGEDKPTSLQYFVTESSVILMYLWKSLWPSPLIMNYGWPVTRNISDAWLPLSLLGSVGLITTYVLIRNPKQGFWLAWIFLILGPTSSFYALAEPAVEYRMHLALLGVIVYAGILIWQWCEKGAMQGRCKCFLLIIGGLYGATTSIHAGNFTKFTTYWEYNYKLATRNPLPACQLCMHYYHKKDYKAAYKYAAASIQIDPAYNQLTYIIAGACANKMQQPGIGIEYLKQAVSRDQGFDPVHKVVDKNFNQNHIAWAYLELGNAYLKVNPIQAIVSFRQAIQHDADYAEAYSNLAMVLARKPEGHAEAEQLFIRSIELNDKNPEAYNNYAILLSQKGETAPAIEQLEKALALKPDFPQAKANLKILKETAP